MQQRLLLLVISILALAFYCSEDDPAGPLVEPGERTNKIRVESDTARAGDRLGIEVFFENREPLTGMVIPLEIASDFIVIDSISFLGSRLEMNQLSGSNVNQDDHQVLFWYYPEAGDLVDTGSGTVFTMHIEVLNNAPSEDIKIDSTTINGISKLGFTDSAYIFIVPDFEQGILHIDE